MTTKCLIVIVLLLFSLAITRADEPSVKSLPASVIRTVPECGNTDVDATATARIEVTFSKPMMDGAWSWAQISDGTFPTLVGRPTFSADRMTCVVGVKLQPKRTYVIWLNSEKFRNFKDADGKSSIPYLLVFQTK
jgi:hypothetical protein